MLRWAYSVGRICVALIFIAAGIQKFVDVRSVATMIIDTKIPIPLEIEPYLAGIPRYEAAGYLLAAIETICGLMVLLGFLARWGALVLVVFTACTIIFVHPFWLMSGGAVVPNVFEALKYLAILGGLLLIVAGGSTGRTVEGHPE
jgi:putative oxidoreductase